MRGRTILVLVAVVLFAVDLLVRPWRAHVSIVTGMAVTSSSWFLGPLVIAVHLLAVVVPILVIAAVLDFVSDAMSV